MRKSARPCVLKPVATCSEIAQRLDEQPGADQEHERERDLDDHQRLAESRACARPEQARAALKLRREVDACRAERRRQAKQQRCAARDGDREREHPSIQRQIEDGRIAVELTQPEEQAAAPVRQQDPERGTGEREEKALAE